MSRAYPGAAFLTLSAFSMPGFTASSFMFSNWISPFSYAGLYGFFEQMQGQIPILEGFCPRLLVGDIGLGNQDDRSSFRRMQAKSDVVIIFIFIGKWRIVAPVNVTELFFRLDLHDLSGIGI